MAEKEKRPAANGPKNNTTSKVNNGFDVFASLQVSYFPRLTDNKAQGTKTIEEVLNSFSQGEYQAKIVSLRQLPEHSYKARKSELPGFTFTGVFPIRKKESIESFTGLMSLDFDEVQNPEQFRDELKKYSFVYAAWISPSGKGVKALLPIPHVENDTEYKTVFDQVQKVFPQIDSACSDLNRLCFVCYDPGLWTNPNATIFELPQEYFQEVKPGPVPEFQSTGLTPWNDFDERGELETILEPIGWTKYKSSGPNEHWCRPGKTNSTSATWHKEKRLFYVFTSNAGPLEPGKAYRLSALHSVLNCNGDFSESSRRLYDQDFGERFKSNPKSTIPGRNLKLFRKTKNTSMIRPKKLFGPLWAEGENAFLFAEDGAGKSILAVQIGCSIATGQQIIGFLNEVEPQPVTLFDAELSDFQFNNRYPAGLPENFTRLTFNEDMQSALVKADLQFVVDQIETAATELNSKIIILDNLAALTSMIDATKTSDAIRLMGLLNDLKKKGFSILIIDHCRKPIKENEFKTISKHDLQGSKMKTNLVDSVFSIGKSCQGENYRYIKSLKIRSYEMAFTKSAVATMYLKTGPLRLDFLSLDAEWHHVNDRNTQISKMASEGKSQAEIAREYNISQQAVSKILNN